MSDIISYYYPALDEVPVEDIQAAREALQAAYTLEFPDLDTRPNSVFGDLWLTPAATHLAALDIAIQRYKSDLKLENVASGVIYDCDFVEAYLKNFSPLSENTAWSYGTIRLVFNSDSILALQRQLQFTATDWTYNLWLPEDGHLLFRDPDDAATPLTNQRLLVPQPNGTWIADVSVYGEFESDNPPEAGDEFETSEDIDELVSATALRDFSAGTEDTKLASIAKLTTTTIHTATPVTKEGVRSFLYRYFPDLVGASAVNTGDDIAVRTSERAVDVHIKSRLPVTETIQVQLPVYYDETDTDDLIGAFVGPVDFPSVPYLVDDITWAGDEDLVIPSENISLYWKTTDDTTYPKCSSGFSERGRLYVKIVPPSDSDESLITTEVIDTIEYATFNVTYRQDSAFWAVGRLLTSDKNVPVGVDVLPKMPIVAFVTSMNVQYTKPTGASVDLTTARSEILEYVNNLLYPNIFNESRIYDTMFFSGASSVSAIEVYVDVMFVPTDFILAASTPEPSDDLVAFEAAAEAAPTISWADIKNLKNTVIYASSNAAVGPENIQYVLDTERLTFEEVSV